MLEGENLFSAVLRRVDSGASYNTGFALFGHFVINIVCDTSRNTNKFMIAKVAAFLVIN